MWVLTGSIPCGTPSIDKETFMLHFSASPSKRREIILTLNLLKTTIVAPPSNARKWQMGFNSAFKGLNKNTDSSVLTFHLLTIIW